MLAPQRDDGLIYERALRAIGRHLDAEPAYNVSILEVDDGFVVRYQPTLHDSSCRSMHFGKSMLEDLTVFQTASRGLIRRSDRHEGMWATFPDGHQDFFRALGFILDCEAARGLTLDELDEHVRISFVRPDPDDALCTQKCEMTFREPDIRAVVQIARKRRGTGPVLLRAE